MLGLSFLFVGTLAIKAETLNNDLPNSVKINQIEFSKKIVGLKTLCKVTVGSQCNIAIARADLAASQAMYACVKNINGCQAAQDYALGILDRAMQICSLESQMEYNQSVIKRRKNPELNSLS